MSYLLFQVCGWLFYQYLYCLLFVLCCEEPCYSWVSHTSDTKIVTQVTSLPGTWLYRTSAMTIRWFGVSVLWVGEIGSLICSWGWKSSVCSVLGSLSCMMQCCGFNPPLSCQYWRFFPWSEHGFWLHCPKTLSDESVDWGLVYALIYSMTWVQKILTFMS